MATPEGKVKATVRAILKKRGAYFFFPVAGALGSRNGVPDIICCYRGWFIGIECKAGKNQPTGLQLAQLRAINDAGGIGIVINETNTDGVEGILDQIDAESEGR